MLLFVNVNKMVNFFRLLIDNPGKIVYNRITDTTRKERT